MKSPKTVNKQIGSPKNKKDKSRDISKNLSKTHQADHSAKENELPVAIVIEKAQEGGKKLPEHLLGA